jgi:hypothetical protein
MDFNTLKLKDVREIETISGTSIGAIGDEESPKGDLLIAMAYVIKKQDDPAFTLLDAENLTFGEVMELIGDADETPKD